jgi:hypothetical protein
VFAAGVRRSARRHELRPCRRSCFHSPNVPPLVAPRRHACSLPSDLHDMKGRKLLTVVAVALLSGCVSGVPVSIENQSSSDLSQVVVSGKGFSESVGTIHAGKTETIRIRPRSETAVKVAFEVNGQRYSGTLDGHIENDNVYTVKATVDPSFSIVIVTDLR